MSHTNLTANQSLYEYLDDRMGEHGGRLLVENVNQTELDALTRLLMILPELRDAVHAITYYGPDLPYSTESAERALCVLNSKRPWLPVGRR